MGGKLPNVIPLLSYKNIVERLRNYAVQQEGFNHDNKRVSKELNELADAIENGQNAANSIGRPDSLVYDLMTKALSKPTRNCDLFGGDKEKLHSKWFEWSRTKEGHNSDGTVKLTFGEWLLEEADKER